MNAYEVMLMLDPELPEERQNEIVSRARELVAKHGGAWQRHEPWGRRKLAYEIDRKSEAHYYLLWFDAEPATVDELSRVLKITDGAMRHMVVRRPAARREAESVRPAEEAAATTQ